MPLQGEAKREYQRDYMRARRSKKTAGIVSKITHPKKLAFLQNYPKFQSITATAEAIGIHRDTVHRWLNKDDPQGSGDVIFISEFNRIKKEIEAELIEKHEKNIDNVAFGDKTPAQSRIFGSLVRLRAIAPEKYRERPPETRLIGDIVVKLAVPPYTDNPILPPPAKQLKEGSDAIQRQGKTEGIRQGEDEEDPTG